MRVVLPILSVVAAAGCAPAAFSPPPPRGPVAPAASPPPTTTDAGRYDDALATPDASSTVATALPAESADERNVLPLTEPWYRDNPDRYEDCEPPLEAPPQRHFPAPFARCSPREEAYETPPPRRGHVLEDHFQYRIFSAAVTTQRRAIGGSDTCCYLVFEFPQRGPAAPIPTLKP